MPPTDTSDAAPAADDLPDRPVPAVALRTYRFLRLSVVGVIVMLLLSLLLESQRTDWCLKGSISAYYYSPARTVFVGSLCAIGLVLVALWGKTAIEDTLFNLAGLLAPVVAFIPAKNDLMCVTDPPAQHPLSDQQAAEASAAARAATNAAITNNMRTYLAVVGLFLLVLAIAGLLSRRRGRRSGCEQAGSLVAASPLTFWLPLGLASVLWLLGTWQFYVRDRTPGGASWFYEHVHFTSAVVMFVLITLGILWVGITRHCGRTRRGPDGRGPFHRVRLRILNACLGDPALSPTASRPWARTYVGQAAAMLLVAGLLFLAKAGGAGPSWYLDHAVFWIELWMIAHVAAFWALQTKERWHEGAPPRTEAERTAEVARHEALTGGVGP
ncbi:MULTISPECIES: hypothetical protein [unclassified Nocardioides]|uniref:hypothetical protein n=1 Tax=unclassified Nocardioides TaxID=2615069 RepID=UPI0030149CF5